MEDALTGAGFVYEGEEIRYLILNYTYHNDLCRSAIVNIVSGRKSAHNINRVV